ncbi:MAG: hypothetical protein J7L66_02520 [Anaerolineaceae bacterium]|nr:hypothetical protein [Anaerolineaceae bacterium]
MSAKLILTWDINPEHEQEYFEFVVREFLPEVQKFGFKLTDAWVTVFGKQPQILVGATFPTIKAVKKIIHSEPWLALVEKLLVYVTNYQEKIVVESGGFQF